MDLWLVFTWTSRWMEWFSYWSWGGIFWLIKLLHTREVDGRWLTYVYLDAV